MFTHIKEYLGEVQARWNGEDRDLHEVLSVKAGELLEKIEEFEALDSDPVEQLPPIDEVQELD